VLALGTGAIVKGLGLELWHHSSVGHIVVIVERHRTSSSCRREGNWRLGHLSGEELLSYIRWRNELPRGGHFRRKTSLVFRVVASLSYVGNEGGIRTSNLTSCTCRS
jgi:hypothetical protein